jgi:hypothetical protein
VAQEKVQLPISAPGADQVVTLLGRIADALDKLEDKAKPASEALDEVSSPSKLERTAALAHNLLGAGNAAIEFGGKVLDGAQKLAELAAGTERTQAALNALGGTAREVEQATAGVVSATDAYNLQQTLVRSGLRVTREELVTLARGARDHARAMGIETPEALQKLGEAIRNGDAGNLRELGIAVRDSTTRAGNMRNALSALRREQANTTPAARSLGEETARLGREMNSAVGAVAALVAQKIGLQGFLSEAADGFRDLAKEVLDYVDIMGRLPQQQAAQEAQLRSLEQYNQAVRRARQLAQETGAQLPNFAAPDQLSREARDRLTAQIQHALNRAQPGTLLVDGSGAQHQRIALNRADGTRVGRAGLDDFDPAAMAAELEGRGPAEAGSLQAALRHQLETEFRDLQSTSVQNARELEAQRARDRRARARAGQGPRDTAGVGNAQTNAAALRAAQVELGVANESLRLLDVRFDRLGQVMDRETQLAELRAEAGRVAAQEGESEDARLSRVAGARNALLQALTEERDRRQQLVDLTQSETAQHATNALGALGTARGGGRLTGQAQQELNNFNNTMAELGRVVEVQRAHLDELQRQLAGANVPLVEQLRLRQLIAGAQQTLTTNEQTLQAMGERDRENTRSRLALLQQEQDQWGGLYSQARAARDAGLQTTISEQRALENRTQAIARLSELEAGYRDLIDQATQEAAAAQTEEQRNAALARRLQLLGQLSAVENERRNAEREDARSDFSAQIAAKFNAALASQKTAAEQFADAAEGAMGNFANAFASAMVAVMAGEATFEDAMKGMLRSLLMTIAQQAIVEALKNVALGIGHLATYNYGGAASAFAAAAAWGAVGVATGLGAGAIKTGPSQAQAQATAGAGQAAGARSGRDTSSAPRTSDRVLGVGGQQGGGLTLNIRVDGYALTDRGVQNAVVRAFDAAGINGFRPRGALFQQ